MSPLVSLPPTLKCEIDFVHDPLAFPYARAVAAGDPYVWYRFKETAGATQFEDSSGHGRHIAITPTNYTFGRPGAISAEAGDTAVALASTVGIVAVYPFSVNLPHGEGFVNGVTWELWVNKATLPGGMEWLMGTIDSSGVLTGHTNIMINPDGGVALAARRESIYMNTTVAIVAGQWNQIVVVVEGTGTDSLTIVYINGRNAGAVKNLTTGFGGTPGPPSVNRAAEGSIHVGRDPQMDYPAWSGDIDEVSIHEWALTENDVMQRWGARLGVPYTTPTYQDVSPYLRQASGGRGRQRELERVEAGQYKVALADPDRRFEPEYISGPYYPNIMPMKELRVRAQGTLYGAPPPVQLSGNEISLVAGEYGIYEPTRNRLPNGDFETGVSLWGWLNYVGTSYFGRTGDQGAVRGLYAARLGDLNGAQATRDSFPVPVGVGEQLTASAYLWQPATGPTYVGGVLSIKWVNAAGGLISTVNSPNLILSTAKQRATLTATAPANAVNALVTVGTTSTGSSGAVDSSIIVDGVQLERQPIATPFVPTNGQATTRGAALARLNAFSYLDETQAWVAFRVRLGWGTGAGKEPGHAAGPHLFDWRDSDANRFTLAYVESADYWLLRRASAGSSTAVTSAQTHVAGDHVTIIAAWTATGIKLSVNGAVFVVAANTNIPALVAALADIGSVGGDQHLDGEVLWTIGGTGTLTDANAATIHGYGNDDPPDIATIPGTASVVWNAQSSALISATDAVPVSEISASLLTGYVPEWEPAWARRRSTVSLGVIDLLGAIQGWTVHLRAPAQPTGARVHTILDKIGWPRHRRKIDAGVETMQARAATDLDPGQELQLAADTEGGLFFVDGAGDAVFHGRARRSTHVRSTTVQATFGQGAGEIPFIGHPRPAFGVSRIINRAIVTYPGEKSTLQTEAIDFPSRHKNGERSVTVNTGLPEDGVAARALAERIIAARKDPRLRFEAVQIEPRRVTTGTAWEKLFGLEISDRVRIRHRPYAGGTMIERDCFVERIEPSYDGGTVGWTLMVSPVGSAL